MFPGDLPIMNLWEKKKKKNPDGVAIYKYAIHFKKYTP